MAQTPTSHPMTLADLENHSTRWPTHDASHPGQRIELSPASNWYTRSKMAFDWLAALALTVPALPLIGICWLAIRCTSRGPGFYLQSRLGRGGRDYRIIKLRTMTHNAELKTGGPKWSTRGDCRITKVGKFLRKTHLDELPQLFNVLMGQMSLVGPRPERQSIIEKFGLETQVAGYSHRLCVRPGVTGLAQVQLPADEDISSVQQKVLYDLYYIETVNLWLDLRIMAATVFKAIGLRPNGIRRLFRLPRRELIVEIRQSQIPVPALSRKPVQAVESPINL